MKIPLLERHLKAVSNFRRLHILQLIKKQKSVTVSDIAEQTGISKFAASQHLRILKNIGILESKKRGWYVTYRLSLKQAPIIKDVLKYL